MCFFQNGKICSDVGIVDLIKAKSAQSCNHLALDIGANRHTKAFAQSNTDRRSCIDNDMFGRIGNCLQYLCGVVLFRKRTGRADSNTLTAGNAGSGSKRLLKCTCDMSMESTFIGTNDTDGLVCTASSNTAAAKDTLVVITIHMYRRMHQFHTPDFPL